MNIDQLTADELKAEACRLAKELETVLRAKNSDDSVIDAAKEILFAGRCTSCWQECAGGRCWGCYESRD